MSSYCKVWINGQEVEADEERKLMDVLRNDLRLKSVKDGCSEGRLWYLYGADRRKSNQVLCTENGPSGRKTHFNGRGFKPERKDVYVYAFGETGAVQCGFCIPGMVICAKGLLDVNPDPSRVEIAYAIRNNYCRCTGYKRL